MIVHGEGDYRSSKAVSFSWLKRFEDDPERFYLRFVKGETPDEPDKETPAMARGTAAHCYILEGPEAFEQRFAVRPETYTSVDAKTGDTARKKWNGNAKVCSGWEEAQEAQGRTVVTPKDARILAAMRASLAANPEAMAIFAEGVPELAIRRDGPSLGFQRQGRLDWINHEQKVIVDLKTIEDLRDSAKDLEKRRYYRQLSYYQDLAEEEYAGEYALKIVWFETTWPYRCVVDTLDLRLVEIGRRRNTESLMRLAECYATGQWDRTPHGRHITPSHWLEGEESMCSTAAAAAAAALDFM